MAETPDAPEEIQIDWLRAIAGALAAVASAVLLSTLGAAGTLLGAAIGSFVATVGSAMFARGISSSKRTLSKRQKAAVGDVAIAQAELGRAERPVDAAAQESHLDDADERLAEARVELDDAIVAASSASWRDRWSRLPWKRIVLGTLGLFLVTMAMITAFELVVGRSVSSITGGSDSGDTTVGQVSGLDSDGAHQRNPDEGPTGSISPSDAAQASDEPTESASPSESQEPTPAGSTAPTPTP